MNVLLVVNHSPWGSTLSATALRFARSLVEAGHGVAAVYFQGDGIYNAIGGDRADPGVEDPASAWSDFALDSGCELLLCSAACARRLPGEVAYALPPPCRLAGLGELFQWLDRADRLVTL